MPRPRVRWTRWRSARWCAVACSWRSRRGPPGARPRSRRCSCCSASGSPCRSARPRRPTACPTARESDLVRILDDLTARNERLAAEERDLQATRDRLASGDDTSATALQEAQQRAQTLGILAGTLPAQGPASCITVTDPTGKVDAAALLDAVEELRDAGAEAIAGRATCGSWRRRRSSTAPRAASSSTVGRVPAPYTILVIGDSHTLAAALRIPGGVVESLRNLGGDGVVDERTASQVTALRPASTPQYARPAASP